MEQRTPEWFEARKKRLTGSEVGAAIGVNPWCTPEQLIRQKVRAYHGYPSEVKGPQLDYGKHLEPVALLDYEIVTGNTVQEVGFVTHPDYDWLGASPDGLIGEKGVLEIKCPYKFRNKKADEIVFDSILEMPWYYAQCQMELFCTRRDYCDFFQFSEEKNRLETVPLDKEWFKKNWQKMKDFYAWFLSEIDNPAHLEDLRKKQDSQELETLVAQYFEVSKEIDGLTETKKNILAKIVSEAGEKDSEINGHKLTRVVKSGSISYAKAIKKLLPDADLEEFRGLPSEYWKLS